KYVTAGCQHSRTAIRQAVECPLRLAGSSQNNVGPGDGNSKRSVILNPLSRGSQSAHVQKIRAEKGSAARREEHSIRLRHVALRANDILSDGVGDQSAP